MAVAKIGNQHISRCMCNAELRAHGGNYRLRRDTTSPENRYLVLIHFNRVAIIGAREIGYTNFGRVADMNGGAMYEGETGGDLDRPYRIGGFHGSHGHHHWT